LEIALDRADVGPVNSGLVGEPLLAESSGVASLAKRFPKHRRTLRIAFIVVLGL
jgi:hypothetical protein